MVSFTSYFKPLCLLGANQINALNPLVMWFSALKSWAPFHIDALGIITIIGTAELDRRLGRLVRYRYVEYLPLLAPQIIASNSICQPIPVFHLYNISDHVVATDLAAWFCRWLQCQELTWNSTSFRVSVRPRAGQFALEHSISIFLMILVMSALVVSSILAHDWWGLANSASMAISVLVRRIVIAENRAGVDRAYDQVAGEKWAEKEKKVLVLTPDGRAVTLYAPCGIITNTILPNPTPQHPWYYTAARWLGWFGFGCQIVTLGMAALANQLITIVVLVAATIMVANGIGCDDSNIGSKLVFSRFEGPIAVDKRSRTYHRLDLTAAEEQTMVSWGLMPQKANTDWWARYELETANADGDLFSEWNKGRQVVDFPSKA